MSCSLNAATGAPGPSWHPEPLLSLNQLCPDPAVPGSSHVLTSKAPLHCSTNCKKQVHFYVIGALLAQGCSQRNLEPTALPYCSSPSSLLPFQEELLLSTLAPAFQTCQESLPMPEFCTSLNKITPTWKTSTLHTWTLPKQLKAGDWAKLFPCVRSWMPGSETCHCYILMKTSENLEFYCQVPKKFSV